MIAAVTRLIAAAAGALAGAAVAKEINKPPEQRQWHGDIAGVPYDFRRPTAEKLRKSAWDPDNPKLVVPHAFGVGWSVNVARLAALVQPPAPPATTSEPPKAIEPPRELKEIEPPKAATAPEPPKAATAPEPPKAATAPEPPKAATAPEPPKAAAAPEPPKAATEGAGAS
jgi:hypothetical protein